KRELNFWVVGGDMRQVKLAQLLSEDGHTVHTYGLERAPGLGKAENLAEIVRADCVILPLPVWGVDGGLNAPMGAKSCSLTEILDALQPGQIACGGMIPEELMEYAVGRGITLTDYFLREELIIATAVPTAEGAVQIALEELPITLSGARVLVTGFGRVGKVTAHRFSNLGARVTVAARNYADLAWADAYGYCTQRLCDIERFLCGYDLVVNTIPVCILEERHLAELRPGALVIDLASKPGGVDFEAAAKLGVRVIWALSLPGKVAPVTAGAAIRDTVYHILEELGG
ncbi:MAG: dipicolinate synthase subunit DpsA, partial [Oscillospiraceae bacterium]